MDTKRRKKRERLANMTDEGLRRKYEKKARKMAAMIAYGQAHEDYENLAKKASRIVLEYLAYISETRTSLERPMDFDEYVERRNEGEIDAPAESLVTNASEDTKWRCVKLISKIAASYRGKPDK